MQRQLPVFILILILILIQTSSKPGVVESPCSKGSQPASWLSIVSSHMFCISCCSLTLFSLEICSHVGWDHGSENIAWKSRMCSGSW